MKNITVIPSFSGSPIHKKSWSLGINQGRAIYCFTLHYPLEPAPLRDGNDDDDNKSGAGNSLFFFLPTTALSQ